ncbi:MAG TPA: AMP-binding protein [Povalibacter sp.]
MHEPDPAPTDAVPGRIAAFCGDTAVSHVQFLRHVAAVAQGLPSGPFMVNLCEDRYCFLVAFAAAQQRRHTVLLPASRAEQVVAEVESANPGGYRCDDSMISAALPVAAGLSAPSGSAVDAAHICMIGFTSGSTGQPKRFPKRWSTVSASTACNTAAICAALNLGQHAAATIVATVPPQHMYGMELSILLPLISGLAVHSGRPLFPADIAQALAQVPAPRILVSTPVHLRAIVESPQEFPEVALIVSATAPLDSNLAQLVERKLRGQLLEMFGSTETCVFANRRTAIDTAWTPYEGVDLTPQAEGTLVNAPWFVTPMLLQDIVELQQDGRFVVRGRNADMIEVAGKRASLADLTRRLLAIDGVTDAVVFQPDDSAAGAVRRVAALVVSETLTSAQILEQLRQGVDPAFLPRPLRIVDRLPRNELGKLPLKALLRVLRSS